MQREIDRYLVYLVSQKGSSENTVAAYRNDLSQLYEFLRTNGRPLAVVGGGDDGFNWAAVNKARLLGFLSFSEGGHIHNFTLPALSNVGPEFTLSSGLTWLH